MNKVRELKIDSTLWATPSKIINLLDFKPEKLSIETKSNDDQQNKYHQVWKEILKIINGEYGELKLLEKIRLFDNDLPIEHVFKIPSITIVIRSLIEKNNNFFLELSLSHCLYETKA